MRKVTNAPLKMILAFIVLLQPIILVAEESEGYFYNTILPIAEFVNNGFLKYVGKYPGYQAKGEERVKYMLETFGKPVKIEKLKKEDWREPFMRDHTIRYFDGLIIETSTEGGDEPQNVETIRVITLENPKYKAYKNIKIGMSYSKFTALLNVKDKKIRNDSITYFIGKHLGGYEATVYISNKGVIEKIVWDYLKD